MEHCIDPLVSRWAVHKGAPMARHSAGPARGAIKRIRCTNCSRSWAAYDGRIPRQWNVLDGKIFCDLRSCNAAYDRARRGVTGSKAVDLAYLRAGSGKLHEPSSGDPQRAACGAAGAIAPDGVDSNCQSVPCRRARARRAARMAAESASKTQAQGTRRAVPHRAVSARR